MISPPALLLVVLTVFLSAMARAEVINARLGTGLEFNGSLAAFGSNDLRWTARFGSGSESAARVGSIGGPWIPSGTRGQWIYHPDTQAPGRYTYKTTFNLAFPAQSTPRLQLRLAADDTIYSVRVNGQHQDHSITGYEKVDTVIVEEGLQAGSNELEIIVYNATSSTGLWCEMVAAYTPSGADERLSAALEEDMLKVSWPVRDPAFSLAYSPSLAEVPGWAPVVTSPDLVGDEFSLKFPMELERGFYRLVKPEITEPPIARIAVDSTGPGASQPVYLASNGESAVGSVSALGMGLGGAIVHRFDAGDSFDPRGGNLGYDWKIYYPSNVNGGAQYTGAGFSGTQASVLEIAANSLPDIGTNLWRAQLTVTSDAGGQPLSRVAEFNFRYVPVSNAPPMVTVVVNPTWDDTSEVVKTGCPNTDGCTLVNALFASQINGFDASASIDPRGGTLSYRWEFRYPTNVKAGGVYTHPGIVSDGPVVTIAPNSIPDAAEFNWRGRLTVTSTLPDGSVLSTEIRFRFQYLESTLSVNSL